MTGFSRLGLFLLVPAVLVLSVSGCGFHLRGEARLPAGFSKTYLSGLPYQYPLRSALTSLLTANGVTVVRNLNEASAVVTLVSLNTSQQLLTVSSLTQADSYALRMTLVFKAHATKGHWKMPLQTLRIQRQYSLGISQLQSQGREQQLLERSMSRELAGLVLLRLQSVVGPAS